MFREYVSYLLNVGARHEISVSENRKPSASLPPQPLIVRCEQTMQSVQAQTSQQQPPPPPPPMTLLLIPAVALEMVGPGSRCWFPRPRGQRVISSVLLVSIEEGDALSEGRRGVDMLLC